MCFSPDGYMWDKSKGCRKDFIWCGRLASIAWLHYQNLFNLIFKFWSKAIEWHVRKVWFLMNLTYGEHGVYFNPPCMGKKVTNTGAPWAPGLQDVITAVSLEIERGVDDTSAACRQQLSCEMSWHTVLSFWPGPLQPNTRNIYVFFLIMRVLTVWRIYIASSSKTISDWTTSLNHPSCTRMKCWSYTKKAATLISAPNNVHPVALCFHARLYRVIQRDVRMQWNVTIEGQLQGGADDGCVGGSATVSQFAQSIFHKLWLTLVERERRVPSSRIFWLLFRW